jgi:FkbM family methyltransferase
MSKLGSLLPRAFKPWLWNRLSGLMHLQYQLPSGVRARIASFSDWCIYNDIFVSGEYDRAIGAALDRATPGQTFRVVDLGANVGFFTLRVLDLIQRRQLKFERIECLLVEASPRLKPSLEWHLSHAARPEVSSRIVIGLVGLKTGEGSLVLKASECMNEVSEKNAPGSRTVAYFDLDGALPASAGIDLLKCDIEGSEKDFLAVYPALLQRTQAAVFEFHDPACPPAVGVPEVMKAGFTANHVLLDQGHAVTIFFER